MKPEYLRRLLGGKNIYLLLALLLLLAAALMKPVMLTQKVYTYQIAFDISQSMQVEDVYLGQTEVSRLMFAKSAAKALLSQLPCGSKVGWSVFTGRRTLTLLTPLDVCQHYSGLLSSLEQVSGQMRWSNGSMIGKGLHQLARAADSMEEPTAIVLITDGHEAPPLELGQRGMPNTDKFNFTGMLLGVGGEVPVPIPKTDQQGNTLGVWQADEVVQLFDTDPGQSHEELSQRHDDSLLKLAKLANLTYLPLTAEQILSEEALNTRYAQDQLAPRDLRWIPALLALLFLCWRFSLQTLDVKLLFSKKPTQ